MEKEIDSTLNLMSNKYKDDEDLISFLNKMNEENNRLSKENDEYNKLLEEKNKLLEKNKELNNLNNNLTKEINKLNNANNRLLKREDKLNKEYNKAKEENIKLTNKINALIDEINNLMDTDINLKKIEILTKSNEELLYKLEHITELYNIKAAIMFAKSSEKSSNINEQISLFNEIEAEDRSSEIVDKLKENGDIEVQSYKKSKRKNFVNLDNANLDVEVEDIAFSDEEIESRGLIDINSDEVSRKLCTIPAKYYIKETRVHKYQEIIDGESMIVSPNKRSDAFGFKSMISNELVSSIITDKFINRMPLYHIEDNLKSIGIGLSRQTMSSAIMRVYDLIKPVTESLKEYIRQAEITRADETGLNVIRLDKKSKSKLNAHVWTFLTGNSYKEAIYYKLGPTRSRDVITEFFDGSPPKYLMSDAYSAYDKLPNITDVYCLAHARREFYDVIKGKNAAHAEYTNKILSMFTLIYRLDNEIRDTYKDDYKTIKEKRLEIVKPVFDELYNLCNELSLRVQSQSKFGKAVNYFLNNAKGFYHIFDDGRLDLDNNYTEREAIKPFVMGRKNWLFANTSKGATVTCALYSLVITAKLNNIKVYDYILYLLNNLPYQESKDINYDDYLPFKENLPEYLIIK